MATKVLKGALIGFVNGVIARNYLIKGPRKFQMDRIFWFHK